LRPTNLRDYCGVRVFWMGSALSECNEALKDNFTPEEVEDMYAQKTLCSIGDCIAACTSWMFPSTPRSVLRAAPAAARLE
jgi:hypothetical protein